MESARKDHPKVSGGGEGWICSCLVGITMESARKDHPKVSRGRGRLEFASTWSGLLWYLLDRIIPR
jgi:hypothetical protein